MPDRDINLSQPHPAPRSRFRAPDRESFGRLSEAFARYLGTPQFMLQMSVFIGIWLGWNTLAPAPLRFDAYAFPFLTLLLSLQASYAAPLILLAQNRQDDRDKISIADDRRRADLNLTVSEFLSRELAEIRATTGTVATRGFVRESTAPLGDVVDRLDRLEDGLRTLTDLLTNKVAGAKELPGRTGPA